MARRCITSSGAQEEKLRHYANQGTKALPSTGQWLLHRVPHELADVPTSHLPECKNHQALPDSRTGEKLLWQRLKPYPPCRTRMPQAVALLSPSLGDLQRIYLLRARLSMIGFRGMVQNCSSLAAVPAPDTSTTKFPSHEEQKTRAMNASKQGAHGVHGTEHLQRVEGVWAWECFCENFPQNSGTQKPIIKMVATWSPER